MGMAHKDIPDMLGRVLSGTKYGVKQTRGKFGLGAKMALIWSKMSTGEVLFQQSCATTSQVSPPFPPTLPPTRRLAHRGD